MLGRHGPARAQKNVLKPWLKPQWKIPHVSAAFVAAMEDVLAVYADPYDPKRPTVNFDETSRQLLAEVQPSLPAQPGQPHREDPEYQRRGTRNLFIHVEPQAGWRHVVVTARRTKHDFAQQMQWLVDKRYPEAEVIRVVLDQLNTHGPASLYEAYAPAEARRLVQKLEFHHTPKHGSWLNMAEIELSILPRQCLDRRIPDAATLIREVAAWEAQRNQERATIDWRFSITDAREKLKHLYPSPSVR
jgi:DDE superfamily endonuclease